MSDDSGPEWPNLQLLLSYSLPNLENDNLRGT